MAFAAQSVELTADIPPIYRMADIRTNCLSPFLGAKLTSDRALSLSREASIFSLMTVCRETSLEVCVCVKGICTWYFFLRV